MERIWLSHYSKGVPSEIDTSTFCSLADFYDQSVKKYATRAAYSNYGVQMTYAEFDKHVIAFAAYLQQKLKMNKGDRIAMILPNVLQFPICFFGAIKAGLVIVNCNPLYTARELSTQLADAGIKTVVVLANMAYVLEQSLSNIDLEHVIVTEMGDMFPSTKRIVTNFYLKYINRKVPSFRIDNYIPFRQALAEGSKCHFTDVELGQADLCLLQYTGGTTGIAKGAMLSHGNLLANVTQAHIWFSPVLERNEQEVMITALPMYHIFSLTCNLMFVMYMGGHNVLITNPRDIFGFVKELKNYQFTSITAVNTLFNALLHVPHFAELDFSRLKIAIAGGMALQRHVAEEWHRITGCPIVEGYGLTETSPIVTINPATITSYTGSIGLPVSSTDVSIRGENGEELMLGEPGEICVKGPQVMKGYWNRPDETKVAFTDDGWFRSGDIATMDEGGYIRIVDRKKDMILVSGFNVFPNEVEEVLATHPGILEVAVIGAPDERSGEAVKAVIVKKKATLTEQEVIEYCQQRMARYKIPKIIEFRTELPKSTVGKILRRALR